MRLTRYRLLLCVLTVGACTGQEVQETLGVNRKAPDEFVVYSRPPLSVPPEFDLKPPRPGEESPNVVTTEDQAREVLLGTKRPPATLDEAAAKVDTSVETAVEPVLSSDAPSSAQSSFLSKAGADKADANIRQELAKDVVAEPKKKKQAQSLYESIVQDEKTEPVVDAKAEAERIRANRDKGKPVTDGETPTQSEKSKSILDKIL
jgi:hypothetical protein